MPKDMERYGPIIQKLQKLEETHDGWKARCPAHDDTISSLTVCIKGGVLMFRCHSNHGCTFKSIIKALEVNPIDCFPPKASNGEKKTPEPKEKQSIERSYDYVDANGKILFQAVRLKPKGFRQRRPAMEGDDPNHVSNGWVWRLSPVEPVLYRLPELIKAVAEKRRIFIPEGEKDVENLIKHGFAATCNPMGAGKWRDHFSAVLKGCHVVVIEDDDPVDKTTGKIPGTDHATDVCESLAKHECTIKRLRLFDDQQKKDVSDWLESHSADDLKRLVSEAPDWHPGDSAYLPGQPSPEKAPAVLPPPVATEPAVVAPPVAGHVIEKPATKQIRLRCCKCGKSVSSEIPEGVNVRAWIECFECVSASPQYAALTSISNLEIPGADNNRDMEWQRILYRVRSTARDAIGMDDA